jgi:hypothetical protein
MCGDECQCDPSKCRSLAHAGTDDNSSDDEED